MSKIILVDKNGCLKKILNPKSKKEVMVRQVSDLKNGLVALRKEETDVLIYSISLRDQMHYLENFSKYFKLLFPKKELLLTPHEDNSKITQYLEKKGIPIYSKTDLIKHLSY